MSLFGDIAGKLTGGAEGGEGGQTLVSSIVGMLSSQEGGLSGLAQAFQQKGLGDLVSSWIGTGHNLPVSADQIQQVLGNEQIQAFAQRMGISTSEAGSKLAEFLPGVVDKLTPDGQVPRGGDLMSAGAGFLQNLMPGDKSES
jgi:uncharacterized protein YidB (DUF937 family)